MDRLLTAEDIAERYSCGVQTARKYMRQMRHIESPLRVEESAVAAWEAGKTVDPARPEKVKPKRVRFDEWTPGMKIPRRIA